MLRDGKRGLLFVGVMSGILVLALSGCGRTWFNPNPCETNADCNDGISCTVDLCNTQTQTCSNEPDDTLCGPNEHCDPQVGCVTDVECDGDEDCQDPDPCIEGSCLGGFCVQNIVDNDRDGYGDLYCGGDDCDDYADWINPGQMEDCWDWEDNDCDGLWDCEDPDCFDQCGGQEICDDGIDNDGDGLVDCADWDCEGHPSCECIPTGPELCGDGIDNDCNGQTDCEDWVCADSPQCRQCYPTGFLSCGTGVWGNTGGPDSTQANVQYSCFSTPQPGSEITYELYVETPQYVDIMLLPMGNQNLNLFLLDTGYDDWYCDPDFCVDYSANPGSDPEVISFWAEPWMSYMVVVDSPAMSGSDFTLQVECDCVPTGPEVCWDGVDNDCNGQTDCDDWQCAGSPQCPCVPTGPEVCWDGVDNDCDGATDCADSDCAGSPQCPCVPTGPEVCWDGVDNDCNGQTDCDDWQCQGTPFCPCVPTGPEQCADGVDNDCNGDTDCDDMACMGSPACPGEVCEPAVDLQCNMGYAATNDGPGSTNQVFGYACLTEYTWDGPEIVGTFVAPTSGLVDVDVTGLSDDLDLFVLEAGANGICDPMSCLDGSWGPGTNDESVSFMASAGSIYYIVLDGWNGAVSSFNAYVSCQGPPPEICDNGMDDDGDGATDCADSDCTGHPSCGCIPTPEVCNDNVDNDCDNQVDCDDPDCSWAPWCCTPTPEICDDGQDNDCDSLADCDDPDCSWAPWCCVPQPEMCWDGQDNDCDFLVDCDDPDCANEPWCCVPEPEVCNDGQDNDCDSLVDCDDSDCDGSPACCVPEPENCFDFSDNDCDSLVDCADPDCAGVPGCQCYPEVCNDNVDNDCDNLTDCADPDCTGSCDCGGTGSPEICFDLQDNDCDGSTDCDDSDCAAHPLCNVCVPEPEICDDGLDNDCDGSFDCDDNDCDGAPACCVPIAEICYDTEDNDCDGLIDCVDPDCDGDLLCSLPCLPFELCADLRDNDCDGLMDCQDPDCFGDPYCAVCEPFEVDCGNYDDDDCDGKIDCADEDCDGHPDCGGTTNMCMAAGSLSCWSWVAGANNAPGSTNAVEDYACGIGNQTGPEYTYRFDMTEFGDVTVRLMGLSADLDLFVLDADGMQCDPDNCVEMSTAGGSSDETIEFFGFPGQSFYIVVDGWSSNTSSFQLEVQCGGIMPGG